MSSEVEKAKVAKPEDQEETIFGKIVDKLIPAKIFYEDDLSIAFHDVNPQAPVHYLVIPKKKTISMLSKAPESEKEVGTVLLSSYSS